MTDFTIEPRHASAIAWMRKAQGRHHDYLIFFDDYGAGMDGFRVHAAHTHFELTSDTGYTLSGMDTPPLFMNIYKVRKFNEKITADWSTSNAARPVSTNSIPNILPGTLIFGEEYRVNALYLEEALSGFVGNVKIVAHKNPEGDTLQIEIFGMLESGDEGYAMVMGYTPTSTDNPIWKPS